MAKVKAQAESVRIDFKLQLAGAASDEGKTLKHWREIACLTDDDKKE